MIQRQLGEKVFICLFCLSFLSLVSGFSALAAEIRVLPIGEMVSRGEVKLITPNGQGKVSSSTVPIFPGSTIKTEKGMATIRLSNNSQIGIHENSTFSFDQHDRLTLSKGMIEFYLHSFEVKIQAGKLSLSKSRIQQAQSGSGSLSKDEPAFGTISLEPNGTIAIKDFEGKISVLNSNNIVVAALGPRESVTVSNISEGKLQVAQAEGSGSTSSGPKEILGLTPLELAGAGGVFIAVVAGITVAATSGGGSSCP